MCMMWCFFEMKQGFLEKPSVLKGRVIVVQGFLFCVGCVISQYSRWKRITHAASCPVRCSLSNSVWAGSRSSLELWGLKSGFPRKLLNFYVTGHRTVFKKWFSEVVLTSWSTFNCKVFSAFSLLAFKCCFHLHAGVRRKPLDSLNLLTGSVIYLLIFFSFGDLTSIGTLQKQRNLTNYFGLVSSSNILLY